MFNLELAITTWRNQMLAAGIKSPTPLEELELHLREEIEQQVKLGLNEQSAFEISARQIGQPRSLENEFNKNEPSAMKTILKTIVVLLTGIALQLPGSWQLRDQLAMSDQWLGLWLLGLVLQMGSLASLRQIIQPKLTGRPLKKIVWTRPRIDLKSGVGAMVLLTGVALMMPAASQSVSAGWIQFAPLCGLVFGASLLLVGAGIMCLPYQRRIA